MKAIVYTEYGQSDALRLEEVKKPALNEEKVLVEVYAASICGGLAYCVFRIPLYCGSCHRWRDVRR